MTVPPDERTRARWDTRLWLLAGAIAGIGLALIAVLVLTNTRWGHAQVLGFTLNAAAERLDGILEVERLDGNLLTGARLYGVALRELDGTPFILADSAFVEYSLRTIAGDEIVIDRLVLFAPEVFLRQLPGDTLWNYDKIFGDTVQVEPTEPRRPIVVRAASMTNARIVIELPWEPDAELSPAEQRQEVAAALADTSRIMVREVPDGYLRMIRLWDADLDASHIVSAPDELGGTSLRVDRLAADLQFYREAAPIRHFSGDLAYGESLLQFRLDPVVVGQSRFSGYGTILFGREEGPRYDVTLRGESVRFSDLQWFYPRLPAEGGGSLTAVVETRPDGTLFLGRDLDIAAPGTRLRGSFGALVNDAIRFVEADLDADPLRIETVEQILPVDLPVVGLRIGAVEIRQPAS